MIQPVSILFHCNDLYRCQRFVENGDLISSVEDGDWLGSGMYFWDNLANTLYWYNDKIKHDEKQKYAIVKAAVSLENLLDLTDTDICHTLDKLWNELCKTLSLDEEQIDDMGYRLNCLYRIFPEFIEKYKIVKVFGQYPRTPRNHWFNKYNKTNQEYKIQPTINIKCIYCIKDKGIILERAFERRPEDEKTG